MPLARWAVYQGGPQIWVAPTADDSDGWQASMRHIAIESGAFVVSVPQYIPGSAFPDDFPAQVDREKVYGRGGAVIVEPTWGGVIAGPLYDREGIVRRRLRPARGPAREALVRRGRPLRARGRAEDRRRLTRLARRRRLQWRPADASRRERRGAAARAPGWRCPPRTAAGAGARARPRTTGRTAPGRAAAPARARRPGRAVDAVRDERVVDVADGQDARRDVELVAGQAARVAGAVEPLVVVEHEPPDGGREAAEVAQQALAGLGVLADLRELGVVERAGLGSTADGTASLPMSCSSPPSASTRSRRRGSPSDSPTCTASIATRRVWPSVAASFSPSRTTRAPHARAEERLLLRDEVGGAEVADERERRGAAAQVQRGGQRRARSRRRARARGRGRRRAA